MYKCTPNVINCIIFHLFRGEWCWQLYYYYFFYNKWILWSKTLVILQNSPNCTIYQIFLVEDALNPPVKPVVAISLLYNMSIKGVEKVFKSWKNVFNFKIENEWGDPDICGYVWVYVCVCMYMCIMYECMYVCMGVSMGVCMGVCMYLYI